MSPLVTRPSRPVPATDDSGTPDSSEMRLADGIAGASALGATGAGAGAAGLGASAFGAAAGLAAGAEPALPSAMAPSSAPTWTVAPAWAEIDSMAPSAGEG